MIERTETHPLKPMLLDPIPELSGHIRFQRVDQAVGYKQVWILMQAVADVRIVPAEVARIDQDRVFQPEVFHLFHLVLNRRGYGKCEIRALRMGEGELWIDCPDFKVCVY